MHFQPPKDLEVEIIEIEGEEVAIFSWPIAPPPVSKCTAAEREILALVERGASNAEIAAARKTSKYTVANQIAKLLHRFGVHSRYELVRVVSSGALPAGTRASRTTANRGDRDLTKP